MDEGGGGPVRYRAFISYSHQDAAAGRRLHRRLERYLVPKRLVGRATARGPVPRRLGPIFRDREDLPAADSLSEEVRAALAGSASLIVVCSPAAKRSPWVAREVALFRSLHPDRPVLAAVIAGTPAEAFPATLADGAREPLAADLQRTGDGPRLGFLKLVAGVVGVGLDELVQRDAQRRLRAVTAVTGMALAGMLAMALLTATAIGARREAERQRAEAEGMVEFMLTDLRDTLEGVGRLDALDAVSTQALAYCAAQQLDRLPPKSRELCALARLSKGTVLQARGDLDAAMEQFNLGRVITVVLLADDPDNPDRMWAHAQSEQAVGELAFEEMRSKQEVAASEAYEASERARAAAEAYEASKHALAAFEAYRALADRLVELEPQNAEYLREAGFAHGNLCSLALADPPDPAEALEHCGIALTRMQAAVAASPRPDKFALDIANRHGWLADAWRFNGDDARARENRLAEEVIVLRLMENDPDNMKVRLRWVAVQRALAALEYSAGRPDLARRRFEAALERAEAMVAHDPTNKDWAALRRKAADDLVALDRLERERLQ